MEETINKLDPEFKSAWLEALRSGKYKKGRTTLKFKHTEEEYHYCCLGVAGEVLGVGNLEKDGMLTSSEESELTNKHLIPKILDIYRKDDEEETRNALAWDLALLNDQNDTFEPVIEYIEKNL